MKKILLTAVVAFSTLVASAQFMVVTNYDNDQEENMDKITANLGIGFMVNDAFTVGLAKAGGDAHEGHDHDDDTYDLWARYNLPALDGGYLSLTMPSDSDDDAGMRIGVGFSFNVWNGLYIEPNYTMNASNDDDGRDGNFNFGLSYRF